MENMKMSPLDSLLLKALDFHEISGVEMDLLIDKSKSEFVREKAARHSCASKNHVLAIIDGAAVKESKTYLACLESPHADTVLLEKIVGKAKDEAVVYAVVKRIVSGPLDDSSKIMLVSLVDKDTDEELVQSICTQAGDDDLTLNILGKLNWATQSDFMFDIAGQLSAGRKQEGMNIIKDKHKRLHDREKKNEREAAKANG